MAALEDSDMITDVGRFVLGEACRQAQIWREEGHLIDMSVNVSARQFETDGLVDDVRLALLHSGLDSDRARGRDDRDIAHAPSR